MRYFGKAVNDHADYHSLTDYCVLQDHKKQPWCLVGFSEDGSFIFGPKGGKHEGEYRIFYNKELGWCAGFRWHGCGWGMGEAAKLPKAIAYLPNSLGETYPHLSTEEDWVMIEDFTTPIKIMTCLERLPNGGGERWGMGIASLKKGECSRDIVACSVKMYKKSAENAFTKALAK